VILERHILPLVDEPVIGRNSDPLEALVRHAE
jgi:hypothetical protein